jgi:hypothetical protein
MRPSGSAVSACTVIRPSRSTAMAGIPPAGSLDDGRLSAVSSVHEVIHGAIGIACSSMGC